ncbi:GlsB/YeaQ/YmgE family stress response membrane protein [Stomatohabitans albus]|uniref:GlsB/YeaQ/YmgE family stress response membrane protein n=1 Tax=Stomatohabitans albus TaxID=3110766 RepID=UPI003AB96775
MHKPDEDVRIYSLLKGLIMGFLAWIVLGLIAGSIVRSIAPGRIEGGWVISLILGVVGALVGGWLSSTLFHIDVNTGFFSIPTWISAIVGGVIVSYVYSFFKGKKA